MTTEELQTTAAKLKYVAKSLLKEVMNEAVKKQAEGGDVLDIESKDIGKYLISERVKRLCSILQERTLASFFTRKDKLDVRGSLILQLLFTNAKRAGDVANLTVDEVKNATETVEDDADEENVVELRIVTHKEARSGKTCSLIVSTATLLLLKKYVEIFAHEHQKNVFVTMNGGGISSSVSVFNTSRRSVIFNYSKFFSDMEDMYGHGKSRNDTCN